MVKHEHTLEPVMVPNPDRYIFAYHGEVLTGYKCTTCPYREVSLGWDGQQRIRRNELCECCDGALKRSDAHDVQDMGRGQTRVVGYLDCARCGHRQYQIVREPNEVTTKAPV